jgi:hypothetical protein
VVEQRGFLWFNLGFAKTIEDAFDEIVVGRRAFRIGDLLPIVIERDKVRERASDVDGNRIRHVYSRSKIQGAKGQGAGGYARRARR